MTRYTLKRPVCGIFVGLLLSGLFLLPCVGFTAADTWTKKADMPTARWILSSSVVNGKIYAIGGALTGNVSTAASIVEEYDPATDTWTRKADMPTPRWGLSTSVVNGRIYAIGGASRPNWATAISTVEVYNPATDTWTRKADMPTPRRQFSTSVVNGKIYAIGGTSGFPFITITTFFSTVEEYDPVTDTWTKKADMPTPRRSLSTSVVNGKIYAIGGGTSRLRLGVPSAVSTVEEYDPMTDTWTKKADMLTPRRDLSASVVNGKIYAIGGEDVMQTNSIVQAYDPVADVWMGKTDMPTVRGWLSTSAVNGIIYAIGGNPAQIMPLSTVEAYDTGFRPPPTVSVNSQGKLATTWATIRQGR